MIASDDSVNPLKVGIYVVIQYVHTCIFLRACAYVNMRMWVWLLLVFVCKGWIVLLIIVNLNFSVAGKPIPTDLRKDADELRKQVELDDDSTKGTLFTSPLV